MNTIFQVIHIFSHIHQTYQVKCLTVNQTSIKLEHQSKCKWVTRQQFMEAAISTAMRKVCGISLFYELLNVCKTTFEHKQLVFEWW